MASFGNKIKTVSFLQKRRIQTAIDTLCNKLQRPPFPKFIFTPELYWLGLCGEDGIINEEILNRVVLDISRHLSIQDKIIGCNVDYHYSDITSLPVAFPEKNPISIEKGIVKIDVHIIRYDESSFSNITYSDATLLFGIIYEIVRYYLSKNGFTDNSDSFTHIAFVFLGFGNYTVGAPFQSLVSIPNKIEPTQRIWSFENWSDTEIIRTLCHN